MERHVFRDRFEQYIKELRKLKTDIELYSLIKTLRKINIQDTMDEQIGAALKNIDKNYGRLDTISDNLIPLLPLYVLRSKVHRLSLEQKWHLIPPEKKSKLQDCLPCYLHYPTADDQIDGPPPAIRSCASCDKFM
ncbi:hypothetical protein Trydic_g14176 [Trypoxylus dichotomus]